MESKKPKVEFTIRAPRTIEEFEDYYELRYKVLREPLGLPRGSEYARPPINEISGLHFAAYIPGQTKPIGAVAGFIGHGIAKVHAAAVSKDYQGCGLGKALMLALEKKFKKRGQKKVYLNARTEVEGFYKKLGYQSVHTMTKEEALKVTGMDLIFIRMEKDL